MENNWQSPKARKLVWGAFAFFVAAVLLVQVAKLTRKPPALPQLAENVPAEARERLMQAWPKILATCPGLEKYYDALTFEQVLMAFPDTTGAYHANLVFLVNKETPIIPSRYGAFGNRCFFGVSSNGQSLLVPKSACQSLCLDKAVAHSGNDLHLPLN